MEPQRHISECQQYPDFRWPKFCERELKNSQSIRRKVYLDRQHQEDDEHPEGDPPVDKAGNRQTSHQKESAEGIDHVVDIKTVPGPLPVAKARQRSIQAVAKPVDPQK